MKIDEHARRSLSEYGEEAENIHFWLDACWSEIPDIFHRDVRHNSDGVKYIAKRWGKKAGEIAKQHIMDDCQCIPIHGFYHCDKYGADTKTRNIVSMLKERTYG